VSSGRCSKTFNCRIQRCEERLSAIDPVCGSIDVVRLDERLVALETTCSGNETALNKVAGND
jgi:hypothetical protein